MEHLEKEGLLVDGLDENGDEKDTEDEFKHGLLTNGYVYIQLADYHIQYEYFEKVVSIDDKNEVNKEETK